MEQRMNFLELVNYYMEEYGYERIWPACIQKCMMQMTMNKERRIQMNDARQYAFYLSKQNINQLDAIRGIKSRSQCVRELIEDAFQYLDYQRAEEYYGNMEETKLNGGK